MVRTLPEVKGAPGSKRPASASPTKGMREIASSPLEMGVGRRRSSDPEGSRPQGGPAGEEQVPPRGPELRLAAEQWTSPNGSSGNIRRRRRGEALGKDPPSFTQVMLSYRLPGVAVFPALTSRG